ncbi:hypothetical protein GMI68_05485 [Eggerthellaceae bacterium zg-886]|uniref:Uncharacterized protein n=2 Tax=Xiamenia xianingshaonis TaxID=2682776 RepID=A0ABX0IIZ7_9ACTN|nr:hypothetical protein [Xiamenia xianingshaonis]
MDHVVMDAAGERLADTADAAGTVQRREQAVELNAARRYLYALGQSLLGNEPTAQRLSDASVALLPEALSIVGLEGDEGVADAVLCAQADVDGACALYTRLFIGPATPKATPWESTYRSRSKALFRQETLAVRNAYRAEGLLTEAYPKVADDHIAIELGFLAALAGRMVDAAEAGDQAAYDRSAAASAAFLQHHLLVWIGDYAADLEAEAPGSLHARLVRLLVAFVRRDAELLAP